MIEPTIKFNKDIDFARLIKFLERTNQQDALNTLKQYHCLSANYDIKQGAIEIKFYRDRIAGVSRIIYITVDSQIDRYALWQYFYQPEHRNDWED